MPTLNFMQAGVDTIMNCLKVNFLILCVFLTLCILSSSITSVFLVHLKILYNLVLRRSCKDLLLQITFHKRNF